MGTPSSAGQPGLDAVDEFVTVADRLVGLPELRRPELRDAAAGLQDVTVMLLQANEKLTAWLHEFRYFTFVGDDPERRFRDLLSRYATARAGGQLHEMKFRCGEIWTIFTGQVRGRLPELFPDDVDAQRAVDDAFHVLGTADGDMVQLIYQTVVAGIDRFAEDADAALDDGNVNAAEVRRQGFKRETAELAGRANRTGAALAGLAHGFSLISGRPVMPPPGAAARHR